MTFIHMKIREPPTCALRHLYKIRVERNERYVAPKPIARLISARLSDLHRNPFQCGFDHSVRLGYVLFHSTFYRTYFPR